MSIEGWEKRVETELQRAETARAEGNEGMARVCARRAAGFAAGEYLTRRGIDFRNPSAFERIKFLATLPDLSPEVRAVCEHFLLRITPDHTLPVEADLVAEARWLIDQLLSDTTASD